MPNRRQQSTANTSKRGSATKSSKSSGFARGRGVVFYNRHIAFYGGVLSNFHQGNGFAGIAVFKHLLTQFDELGISHPSPESTATQLISEHHFLCGEQFMMAMKSYLFECPAVSLLVDPADEENAYAFDMKKHPDIQDTILLQILHATDPPKIKALGRRCPDFSPRIWDAASPPIVTAACVARAEKDGDLAAIYQDNFDADAVDEKGVKGKLRRGFVEGSPTDRIWGVGMGIDNTNIDDERNWRGQNRLGDCHDQACLIFGRRRMSGSNTSVSVAPEKTEAVAKDEQDQHRSDAGGEEKQ
jgi:ribA/ribD-fused uncharacterized protein